jgi:hypothetical protein
MNEHLLITTNLKNASSYLQTKQLITVHWKYVVDDQCLIPLSQLSELSHKSVL